MLETLPNQPRGYTAADKPVSATTADPPACTCPTRPWSQSNPVRRQPDFNDGVDSPTGKGTDRVGTARTAHPRPVRAVLRQRRRVDLLNTLLGPPLGSRPADQVPDLGGLLLGPMARGAKVSIGDDPSSTRRPSRRWSSW